MTTVLQHATNKYIALGSYLNKNVVQPLSENLALAVQYIRHPNVIGTIAPSSDITAEKMVRKVTENLAGGRKILEIGAGTGAITKRLLVELREGDHLDVVEYIPKLAKIISEIVEKSGKSDQVTVHNVPIQEFDSDVSGYDHIVSTLPLNTFKPSEVKGFYRQLDDKLLANNGTLSYIELMAFPTIRLIGQKIFSAFNAEPYRRFRAIIDAKNGYLQGKVVEEDIVVRNLPPARVTHVMPTPLP